MDPQQALIGVIKRQNAKGVFAQDQDSDHALSHRVG